jgi:hypothetical protein
MKKLLPPLLPPFIPLLFSVNAEAQSNCMTPTSLQICPSVTLMYETNFNKGDNAPFPCNLAGEDVVYRIGAPNGASKLFVSFANATSPLRVSVQEGSCGTSVCNSQNAPAGNSNLVFNVSNALVYYLWVDAPVTVKYDITIGGDTGSVWINIPNTQGNWSFDSSLCAWPPFHPSKHFIQVSFNGVFQVHPMTLAPLNVPGTLCIATLLKNTTGIEAVKQFKFEFPATGFSNISATPIVPGFYNTGNWILTGSGTTWFYTFYDQASTGKGDFTGNPNTCLRYEFCFTITPLSNNPNLTNILVNLTSDGFGAGFSGWIKSGCCPSATPNCLGGTGVGSSGSASSMGFGVNDPGGPLPVQLLHFYAAAMPDKTVQLKWATASEVNNDYFLILRSTDGIHFGQAGKVNGHGTTTQLSQYDFTDRFPLPGKSYYRMLQVDYDGNLNDCGTRNVFVPKAGLQAWLNTLNEQSMLYVLTDEPKTMRMELFGLNSTLISKKDWSLHDGLNTLKLPVKPSGSFIYILKLVTDDEALILKGN